MSNKNRKIKHNKWKIAIISMSATLGLFIIIGVGFYLNFVHFTFDEKLDPQSMGITTSSTANGTTIYDDSGEVIETAELISLSNNTPMELEVQNYTKNAFVAIEDKRFYQHNGIDWKRIVKATLVNIFEGEVKEGGSTISQQVIKNTHLTPEKTLKRKMKEIKLAGDLEKTYTKDEILNIYLSSIYFGNGQTGIVNASKYYFNKQVNELTIAESAMLAGIIQAPTAYDPLTRWDLVAERKNFVLSLMLEQAYITVEEYESAVNQEIKITATIEQVETNTYEQKVINEAIDILDISESEIITGGYKIWTYKDDNTQKFLEEQLNSKNYSKANSNGYSADTIAMIIDNKSMGIIAYKGDSKKDTTNLKRSPASIIKPILVYAPAIEEGLITGDSTVIDSPINIAGYAPQNATKKNYGEVTIKQAVKESLNIPAVKVLQDLGVEKAIKFAKKLGIEFSENDKNLSIALGGISNGETLDSLCNAYTSFANDGYFQTATFIKKIESRNGTVLYINNNLKTQAMSKQTSTEINDILLETVKSGTAQKLSSLDFDIAGKTGTASSSDFPNKITDCYTISYTKEHTIGVWQGSLEGEKGLLEPETNGSVFSTLLNKKLAEKLYEKNKPEAFEKKANIVELSKKITEIKQEVPKNVKQEQTDILSNVKMIIDKTLDKTTIKTITKAGYKYYIIRENDNNAEIIFIGEGNDKQLAYIDEKSPKGIINYYILADDSKKEVTDIRDLENAIKSNQIKVLID